MLSRRPILVTGAHRSGTTWVGKMLAEASGVRYISEPFRTSLEPCPCGVQFDYQFQYISPDNERRFHNHVRHAIGLSFYAGWSGVGSGDSRGVLRRYASYLRARVATRPLIKDPIAVFSAEWLASTFDAQVVVMIRHPAAFASSIMRFGWSHPFSEFLAQPLLMEDHLQPFRDEIEEFAQHEHEIIDQAALLWRLIYFTVLKYRDAHPSWLFLSHEDLATDPLQGFESLFGRLNLEWDQAVKYAIEEHSRASNPREPADPYGVKRDSKRSVGTWKERLSEKEVLHIRSQVEDVAKHLYRDEEW